MQPCLKVKMQEEGPCYVQLLRISNCYTLFTRTVGGRKLLTNHRHLFHSRNDIFFFSFKDGIIYKFLLQTKPYKSLCHWSHNPLGLCTVFQLPFTCPGVKLCHWMFCCWFQSNQVLPYNLYLSITQLMSLFRQMNKRISHTEILSADILNIFKLFLIFCWSSFIKKVPEQLI